MTNEEMKLVYKDEIRVSNEMISSLANKFFEEIISNKLTKKEVDRLIVRFRDITLDFYENLYYE